MLGVPAGFAAVGLVWQIRGYATGISQLRRMDTQTRAFGDTMGAVATKSQRLAMALGMLGTASIAVGAGLTAALKPIVEASDELRRLDIMGRGVASGMAISTEAILAERKELAQLDVTAVQALRSLNALTMMHLDFTKASDLATAALNIAAFTGERVDKVYEDITRAVANASTMGLRAYKITATTERVYAAYAATLGKTARELTVVERSQAVLNYILAVGTRVTGAYEATIETLWGQLQRLRSEAGRIAETLGQYLLPRLIELLKYANMLLQRFGALPESTKEVIIAFAAKAAVVLTVAGAVAMLLPVLKLLTGAFFALAHILVTTVWGALKGTYLLLAALGPAGWIAAVAIAAVVVAIKANWLGLGDWFDREIGGWFTGVQTWAAGMYEGLVAPFRMANQEIRNITGSLSDEDFGFDWAPGELFDDFADRAKRAAKEALWAIQDVLFELATRALDLDRLLYPFEDALTRVRAAADLVVIPLERQRRALERQLYVLEKLVRVERGRAEQSLRELDLILRPFEDALTRIRALADLVVIPLERQRRVLQRQVDELEKIAEAERERAERRLRELEKQEEALRELTKADEERLDYLDWEIFMEQQRNKILRQATSVRLLELQSQKALAGDQAARRREELSGISDARRAEKERLEDLKTAAEKQIEAVQARIDALTESIELEEERVLYAEEALRLEQARQAEMRLALAAQVEALQLQIAALIESIGLEEERVLWAREALSLAQARQVEARLALLAETRLWQEEQRQAQHALDIINRIPDAIRAIAEAWTFELPGVPTFPAPGVPEVPGLPEVPGAKQITPRRPSPFQQWFQIPTLRERDEVSEGINKWLDDFFAEDTKRAAKRRTELEARWSEIKTGWGAFWGEIGKLASDFWTGFTTWWGEKWEEFKVAWPKFWGEVQKLVEEFWTGFTTFWGEVWEAYKTRLAKQWRELKAAWKAFWDAVQALIVEWWEGVKEWWGERYEEFKQLGKDLVDGIREGIEDKWKDFKTWLKGKFAELPDWLKKFLGITSPAKITEPIGVALIEGIQVGMQKALSRLTRGLQASVALNVARPLGQVSSVPATSTVTNNYYIRREAPSVSIAASYAREQSQASIVHDVEMLLAMT